MSQMNEPNSDSDTSDEDYIPGAADSEKSDVSHDSSDGDAEKGDIAEAKKLKRKKKSIADKHKRRKGGIKLDEEDADASDGSAKEEAAAEELETELLKSASVEKEKLRTDALWADFMSDVGGLPAKKKPIVKQPVTTSNTTDKDVEKPSSNKDAVNEKKVSITKIYDFAGEEVRVTKEVSAQSKEAKQASEAGPPLQQKSVVPTKRTGGVSGLLQKLNKKPKMSVLDKSKLDWTSFKQEKGIEDELDQYKKGKDGYLDKQDFLQRTDLRQFEIEKNLRQSKR